MEIKIVWIDPENVGDRSVAMKRFGEINGSGINKR